MCNNSVITVFRIEGTSSERLGLLLGREMCYNSYYHVPD